MTKEWEKKKDKYGLFHFPAIASGATKSTLEFYIKNILFVPTVSGENTTPFLSDSKKYP